MHVAGARQQFIREHNESMSLAWHVEAFHRSKKMPKLEAILHSDTPTKTRQQSADEQIAVLKGILAGRKR